MSQSRILDFSVTALDLYLTVDRFCWYTSSSFRVLNLTVMAWQIKIYTVRFPTHYMFLIWKLEVKKSKCRNFSPRECGLSLLFLNLEFLYWWILGIHGSRWLKR